MPTITARILQSTGLNSAVGSIASRELGITSDTERPVIGSTVGGPKFLATEGLTIITTTNPAPLAVSRRSRAVVYVDLATAGGDVSLDIQAGAQVQGYQAEVIAAGPAGRQVVVTYASGQAIAVAAGNQRVFTWSGTLWQPEANIQAANAGTQDLNSIIYAGFYRIQDTNLNKPAGVEFGQLIVARGASDTIIQIVADYISARIYWRSGDPPAVGGFGSWGVWREFVHAGNFASYAYPVGSYYTQYPDAGSNDDATEFPAAQRPAALFGGTWVEQWSTESVYFRTRGSLADSGRTNGKQEDAFQGHYHTNQSTFGGASGSAGRLLNVSPPPGADDDTVKWPKSDGVNGTPRTATETRTVNRRIKVWKRTA